MRKVELRMFEEEKYTIIKKLVETDGNKKNAAIKLGCTIRTINRLIIRYRKAGKSAFVHGNRGRQPITTYSPEFQKQVTDLYKTKYSDSNYTHFVELLKEHEDIIVSDTTVHKWLYLENVISPKATKRKRKLLTNKLKAESESTSSKKQQVILAEAIETIESHKAHPRHPRATYMGEIIQMDASEYYWFNDVYCHLHVAIDDASGQIVGAYFDHQETLNGYYNVTEQILNNHGIPAIFKVDKRTVFEYKRKNAPSDSDDTFTQFSYACKVLGIEIHASSVPQSKGRVERLNQTLQSRLPVELSLAGVTTIEEANIFLNEYIKRFNSQFSLALNSTKSAYVKQPSKERINQILSVSDKRVIDAGHSIKYKNSYYLPVDQNGEHVFFANKTAALVIKCLDGTLYANIHDHLYLMELIEQHYEFSKHIDFVEPTKAKKVYIPLITHPWKQASFNKYLENQSHRPESQTKPLL